ncbi:hypothetical protein LTR36_007401 [Oleoguttula mirabilis]|uniref:Uncharacterized protein n=1 Tax=Oleoguttula mirabilis TaxID=1507867 RepID=A0AAV9JAB4_9PEZI|nr:hypothetical protein LTR36_007401 [Oleoguttula mirabilis]
MVAIIVNGTSNALRLGLQLSSVNVSSPATPTPSPTTAHNGGSLELIGAVIAVLGIVLAFLTLLVVYLQLRFDRRKHTRIVTYDHPHASVTGRTREGAGAPVEL